MKKFIPVALMLMASFAFAQKDMSAANQDDAEAPAASDGAVTPGDEANAEMDGLGEWLDNSEAQTKAMELMQQGKYVRKSLMILPHLYWLGEGGIQIRPRHKPVIIKALRDSLMHMSRFDINPVNTKAARALANTWTGTPGHSATLLDQLVKDQLSVDLLGSMMGAVKERAEKNLTEDQVNSFMVDKAKESGVTAAELNLVLNSGYVVVPVTSFLAYGTNKDGGYEATVKGGVILYKVQVTKEKIWLEKRADLIRTGRFTVDKDGYSALDIVMVPAAIRALPLKESVMYGAIDKMLSAVMQDMRDLPEFRLLSQISWAEKEQFQAPFGSSEIKDVPLDKFFEQVESIEKKDGSVKDEITAWGFVNKPYQFKYPVKTVDSNVAEYTWQGYMPSGTPQTYATIREYSRVPIDVDFRLGVASMGLKGSLVNDTGALVELSGMGLYGQLQTMIAPVFGVSQLAFRIDFNYKMLPLDSGAYILRTSFFDYDLTSIGSYDIGFGLQKKFWMGRIVPSLGVDLTVGEIYLNASTPLAIVDYGFADYYVGARATLGAEYAITPNFRLGVSGAGTFNSNLGSWAFTVDGKKAADVTFAETPKMTALGFEAGVYVMINAWPLRKAYDAILDMATSGTAGAIMNGSLSPIP
jgi:hypothetical protein